MLQFTSPPSQYIQPSANHNNFSSYCPLILKLFTHTHSSHLCYCYPDSTAIPQSCTKVPSPLFTSHYLTSLWPYSASQGWCGNESIQERTWEVCSDPGSSQPQQWLLYDPPLGCVLWSTWIPACAPLYPLSGQSVQASSRHFINVYAETIKEGTMNSSTIKSKPDSIESSTESSSGWRNVPLSFTSLHSPTVPANCWKFQRT